MTGLPFTDPVAAPAVRTPKLKIRQPQDSGGGPGGLGGAVGAFLGAGQGADPWVAYLLELRMTLALGNHVDYAIVHVMDGDDAPTASLGDTLTFSLGFDDAEESLFFTGSVSKLEATVSGYRRLTVASPLLALAHKRINTSFEEQSASDIVRALLGETEVAAGTIDAGEQYPFYVVSDTHSALAHIQRLAEQQNWLCYCGPDGKLYAHAVATDEAARTFAFGVDIVELEHSTRAAALGGVRVVGGGAATSDGADAWNWLTKEARVLSDTGDASRVVPMRALRDAPGAGNYAAALTAADSRNTNRIRLLTSVAPEILPGTVFAVEGVPTGQVNGTYIAARVVLSFDHSRGFLSRIEGFNRDAAAPAAAGALAGLL